jgi:hypothetical protein
MHSTHTKLLLCRPHKVPRVHSRLPAHPTSHKFPWRGTHPWHSRCRGEDDDGGPESGRGPDPINLGRDGDVEARVSGESQCRGRLAANRLAVSDSEVPHAMCDDKQQDNGENIRQRAVPVDYLLGLRDTFRLVGSALRLWNASRRVVKFLCPPLCPGHRCNMIE